MNTMNKKYPKIKSVLRYPGGKSKAVKTILKYIPRDFKEFREPFVGGGSIFITLKRDMPDFIHFSINDINPDVYLFWRYLSENGENFKDSVVSEKNRFDAGRDLFKYYSNKEVEWSDFEKAVRFFILNRITFSGLVDSGGYSQESYEKRFTESIIDRLIPLANLIKDIEITNLDYSDLLMRRGEDVFLFLDPPYFNSKGSKLYGKNGDLHTTFDHNKFAHDMKNCTHRWLITCDDSLEIRELFDFANINCWKMTYAMTNSHNSNPKKKGNELIITNYEISQNPDMFLGFKKSRQNKSIKSEQTLLLD